MEVAASVFKRSFPQRGIQLLNKKEQTTATTWMDSKSVMLSEKEKLISKGHTMHDSIYTIVLKRENYRDGGQVSGC